MKLSSHAQINTASEEAKSLVTKYAAASGAAGLSPLPGVDAAADVAMLLKMIPEINKKFGLAPEQIQSVPPFLQKLIYEAIKANAAELAGKYITKQIIMQALKKVGVNMTAKQVAKFIPFLGQVISGGISFVAMKSLGNIHVDQCANACRTILKNQSTQK